MPAKLTTEKWIEKAVAVHGTRYDYSRVTYTGSGDKVEVVCPTHGSWMTIPKSHLSGRGCQQCGRESVKGKLSGTQDQFLKKAKAVHETRYDYSLVEYKNSTTPVRIVCAEHGEFLMKPSQHLSGGKCPQCKPRRSKLDQDTILERFANTHGNLYDYSRVSYLGASQKVEIVCADHGSFFQRPSEHIQGQGCPTCGVESSATNRAMSQADFIRQAASIHGVRYDYSKVDYINATTSVEIVIAETGESFFQQPSNHLQGHQSVLERNRNLSQNNMMSSDGFIQKAKQLHGDTFDYSRVDYHGTREPVEIICSKHGSFMMQAMYHLQGSGCPRCAVRISRGEQEMFEFCQSLITDEIVQSNRSVIAPLELDIYIPDRAIAIEYCGLIWHSGKFMKDTRRHMAKHEACERQGIRLITVFEDEWRFKQDIVKSTIRHFLGKSPMGVGARKTEIRQIDWATAKPLLQRQHLLGSGTPGNYRLGAFHGDELVSVMVFGSPAVECYDMDTIEMKRFVTNGNNNPGVGSKMFTHAVKEQNYKKVIAFVDRRWFTGTFKFASGFAVEEVTNPSKYWTNGSIREHRRFKTKAGMLKSGDVSDPSLTKEKMLEQIGYYPIYDCGKIRLAWTAPSE